MKHTAILLAGSRPGRDHFAEQFGTDIKALIAVAGEPKVIPSDPRIAFRESLGTIAETMLELCDDPQTQWPLLVTTADHALLDTAMIDEFVRGSDGADVAVGVVQREVLMRRFPDA